MSDSLTPPPLTERSGPAAAAASPADLIPPPIDDNSYAVQLASYSVAVDAVDHAAQLVDGVTVPVNPWGTDFGITDPAAWRDIGERVLNSVWQAVSPRIALVLASGGIAALWTLHMWAVLAVVAGSAAVVSFFGNLLAWRAFHVSPKGALANVAIGTVRTFIGALAGYVLADAAFNLVTFDWVNALTLSAGTALLSIVSMRYRPALKQAKALTDSQAQFLTSLGRAGRHEAPEEV